MRGLAFVALAAVAGAYALTGASKAEAQVSINIGVAPECPYGYYDAAPYRCAPYGYYGPEWFNGAVFIGAGPWFHGARDFRGHVNESYRPERGYKGHMPKRGERADPSRRIDKAHFSGKDQRDGRGHASGDKR